ncbi:MAG: hypothetical protein R3D88_09595 [Alphaproteobacteria bacterium]|nr:hypothetical protein [Alphaproteobacteria bacterium]
MLYQRVTPEAYLTSAVVYHKQSDQLVGSITASAKTLETYLPQHHEFYCGDCLDQGHAMRLIWIPRESCDIPERFRHYKYADATHVCDHPVRYQKLDELAVRYNAKKIGNHQYIFDTDLEVDSVVQREDRSVDQASRVAKITEALLYDKGLRQGQKLMFESACRDFEDAVYDTSSHDKLRLYRDSMKAAKISADFYAAMIFRPIGNRTIWKAYEVKNCIPGIPGKEDDLNGVKLKPSALLWCSTKEIYHQVCAVANRNGTRKSAALMVHGEAQLNLKAALARTNLIKAGQTTMHGIYTSFIIRDAAQVSAWDYDILTFEEAEKRQRHVQVAIRKEKPGLFKPQMGLDL